MSQKSVLRNALIALAAVLLAMAPASSMAAPDQSRPGQVGGELLTNPGFEGISCEADTNPEAACRATHTVHIQDGIPRDNIRTPIGWVTWWREEPQNGWTQPEVVIAWNNTPGSPYLVPPRIRSGAYAMKVFGSHGTFDGGFYQVVTGLTPGATVQFSAYAHSWTCDTAAGDNGTSCGDPGAMPIYVGIEPNGLADPFSPSIIWSPAQFSQDTYRLIGPVTANVGASGTIVVYLRSTGKWATRHGNDAYWDDASLVYVGPVAAPTNTPQPVPPTPTPGGPTAVPLPTSTPRPDGAIVHVVQSGDTLFGIALMYGVDVDQIRQLNAGSIGTGDLIVVGQELVISLPAAQPTAVPPAAEPTEASAAGANPAPAVAGAAAGTSICVQAYHDRNGDTFRDAASEELLPGAEFAVADASGVLARYTTDGVNEPYCFPVAPGAYRVIQTSPAGYAPSGQAEQAVAVAEGATLALQFGNTRSEGTEGNPEVTVEPASAGEENPGTPGGSPIGRILATVAKVSGILVLLLAAGMAVLFVLNRRRM
jgi:LysM repeat protein